ETIVEGQGVVVRDAEDLVAVIRRLSDEGPGVVCDPGLRLAGVKVEVGFQQTHAEGHDATLVPQGAARRWSAGSDRRVFPELRGVARRVRTPCRPIHSRVQSCGQRSRGLEV